MMPAATASVLPMVSTPCPLLAPLMQMQRLVQGEWRGKNMEQMHALLEGRSLQQVQALLSHPKRSAVSELEVSTAVKP